MSMQPIIKYLELNNTMINDPDLRGWIIRERIQNKKPISFEMGCYLEKTDDKSIFVSMPVHVSIKRNLRHFKTIMENENDGYNFYIIPRNLKLMISTYKTKKGIIRPILIDPKYCDDPEYSEGAMISCFAIDVPYGEKILNAEILTDSSLVLSKYISKDRNYIGVITIDTRVGCINPDMKIRITSGIPNTTMYTRTDYTLSPAGISSETHTLKTPEGEFNKTEFISFNDYKSKAKEAFNTTAE